jgi:hypothetical protein
MFRGAGFAMNYEDRSHMTEKRKFYARYPYVRGNQALWRGDPSEGGAQFRQIVVTSNEWMLNQGVFQVYALEGTGNGIVDGKFSASPNPKVLCDEDVEGLEAAGQEFGRIVKEAEQQGFKRASFIDELEFQAKLKASSG